MDNFHEALHSFFDSLETLGDVYAEPHYAFLVKRSDEGYKLLNSQVSLQPLSVDTVDISIDAGDFLGFSGKLSSTGTTVDRLVEMATAGYLPTPTCTLRLARERNEITPTFFRRQAGMQSPDPQQQRLHELFAVGLSDTHWPTEADDWALRSATTPFSHLNDLYSHLGLSRESYQLHFLVFPPVLIGLNSRIRGETAHIEMLRTRVLSADRVRLGVIVSGTGGVVERSTLLGTSAEWGPSQNETVLVGKFEVPVPKAGVVHCLAVVDDECMHHFWITDPEAFPNALRSIYEIFDPNLEDLRAMLSQAGGKANAPGLEAAASALLWILGFSPLHLLRFSEAPDIVAVSRDGHFVVIECTTADLQTKQKKPHRLLERAAKIRNSLDKANASLSVCIPVMLTSRRRADVLDDVKQCEKKGIVVYTQDDIEDLMLLTMGLPRSDVRFSELKSRPDAAISEADRKAREETQLAKSVQELQRALSIRDHE